MMNNVDSFIVNHQLLTVHYLKNLVGDGAAGGLYLYGFAGFLADKGRADGGLEADAAFERVDFLFADDAVYLFAAGLLVD